MKRFLPILIAVAIFAAAALITYGRICKGEDCAPQTASVIATSTSVGTTSVKDANSVIDNKRDFDVSGAEGAGTVISSGIRGKILLGPTCPVVQVGHEDECADRPYKATVNVETVDGIFVKSFTSGEDGAFYAALLPGTYILLPVSSGIFPIGKPQTVSVQEGVVLEVNVFFDSGIR